METFLEWLISEDRRPVVSPGVLQGYEAEFRRHLERLIQCTDDPVLRQKFGEMLDCPVTDSRGRCHSFTDYIVSSLIRQGVHRRFDIEQALGHIVAQMLLDRSLTTGLARSTVFGSFDPHRPYQPGDNPLQARFLVSLNNAIRNITSGRIPRLANVERRPQGTVSIGFSRGDREQGTVAPDEIADRPSGQAQLDELLGDIRRLLQRKEAAAGVPLVAFFDEMMAGMRNADQRKKYGDRMAKLAREAIIETIRQYAESTGNFALLNMLRRFEDFDPTEPMEPRRKAEKATKPMLTPKEQDYSSIVALIEKLGRPVGTADLGKYRRKWLTHPPRDPNSPHRNRLDATLAAMVADGVLLKRPTGRGGFLYSPGPNFERFQGRTVT